ncbi:MAG TPA: hypothetical protein VMB50_16890, partial [Myxococcales bacterium]|nr:hypothetical protein [Myxococcales bacterium]
FAPDADGGFGEFEGYATTTDPAGHYQLLLPAGKHELWASNAQQSAPLMVDAVAGADQTGQDFVAFNDLSLASGPSVLEGYAVFGTLGASAPEAQVQGLAAELAVGLAPHACAGCGLQTSFQTPDPAAGVSALQLYQPLTPGQLYDVEVSPGKAIAPPIPPVYLTGIPAIAGRTTLLRQIFLFSEDQLAENAAVSLDGGNLLSGDAGPADGGVQGTSGTSSGGAAGGSGSTGGSTAGGSTGGGTTGTGGSSGGSLCQPGPGTDAGTVAWTFLGAVPYTPGTGGFTLGPYGVLLPDPATPGALVLAAEANDVVSVTELFDGGPDVSSVTLTQTAQGSIFGAAADAGGVFDTVAWLAQLDAGTFLESFTEGSPANGWTPGAPLGLPSNVAGVALAADPGGLLWTIWTTASPAFLGATNAAQAQLPELALAADPSGLAVSTCATGLCIGSCVGGAPWVGFLNTADETWSGTFLADGGCTEEELAGLPDATAIVAWWDAQASESLSWAQVSPDSPGAIFAQGSTCPATCNSAPAVLPWQGGALLVYEAFAAGVGLVTLPVAGAADQPTPTFPDAGLGNFPNEALSGYVDPSSGRVYLAVQPEVGSAIQLYGLP